jgi:septum formation protein
MKSLILASASKWRAQILSTTRIPFTVEESGYDEDMTIKMSPRVMAKTFALGKARMVASRHRDAVVLGADTFVVFRGRLLGKPYTAARARQVLVMLSGKTHVVLTGYAIVDSKTGKSICKVSETKVLFRKLSKKEINDYVATGEPLNAAGSYTGQSGGASFMKSITGSHYNIVGLPIAEVVEALRKFGF